MSSWHLSKGQKYIMSSHVANVSANWAQQSEANLFYCETEYCPEHWEKNLNYANPWGV